MLIKILITGLIITTMPFTGLAANSVFSFYGFPNQEGISDIYGTGMGETGIGNVFRKNTGYLNPSLSTTLNQVYFSTGIMYGFSYFYDDQENDFRKDSLHFPYFNITVPLKRHRIGFDFSPTLSGNLDNYSFDNVQEINGYEFHYNELNRVRSYIYKASILYAYKHRIVNVGFSLDYHLGHHFRGWQQYDMGIEDLADIAPEHESKYEFNRTFREPGFTVGLNKRLNNFAFGALYRNALLMKGNRELATWHTTFDMGESQFELPHKIGFGAAYRFSDSYRMTADMEIELWSETESYENPSDTYRLGIGFSYEPYGGHDEWFRKIPLRTGGYYRTLPFRAGGNELSEIGFTMGFSLPLPSPNAHIDFAVKYMVRGDTGENGYQDRKLLFGVGLSGFDFFRSRPRRIEPRDIPEAEFEGFR